MRASVCCTCMRAFGNAHVRKEVHTYVHQPLGRDVYGLNLSSWMLMCHALCCIVDVNGLCTMCVYRVCVCTVCVYSVCLLCCRCERPVYSVCVQCVCTVCVYSVCVLCTFDFLYLPVFCSY